MEIKKIAFKPAEPFYSVTYHLFSELEKKGVIIPDNVENLPHYAVRHVCFSRFFSHPLGVKKLNRIFYKPVLHVPDDVAMKWINLAVDAKLLPSYVNPEHVKTGFVLKFGTTDKACTFTSLLYVYLTMLRCLSEEPGVVELTFQFVKEYKMNVYFAFVLATIIAWGNLNHSFIAPRTMGCLDGGNWNQIRVPMHQVIALRRFVDNPRKYDNRILKNSNSWMAYYHICKATPLDWYVKASDADNPLVITAINCDSNEEIRKHAETFLNK